MKKLITLILLISCSFAGFFGKNKLNIVWVGYNSNYSKIVNILIKNLKNNYEVKLIKTPNTALLSLINDYNIYSNPIKLKDGINADNIISKLNGNIIIFNLKKIENKYEINGIKYNKNDKIIYKLKISKKINSSKELFNLLYFYIKSEIPKYNYINRAKASPITYKQKNSFQTEYYINKKVMLFKSIDDNIKLAKKLHLISNKNSAQIAKDYCNLLNLDVANKTFSEDDDITYEDFYSIIDFKNGFKIYKIIEPNLEKESFRCIGRESKRILKFDDFILNKIGLYSFEKQPYKYKRKLIPSYPYSYIFKENNYKIDLNHVLYYKDNKLLTDINNAIKKDYNHILAYDKEYLYNIYGKKIVKKIKLQNIQTVYKIKNHIIASDDKGQIFILNNQFKLINTLPQIGIFFYKFEHDNNYLYAYNSNGFKYKFLIKKLIGE